LNSMPSSSLRGQGRLGFAAGKKGDSPI
jgi:NADH:ubiquinone oxidoreductase subunit F (NADH-binding)